MEKEEAKKTVKTRYPNTREKNDSHLLGGTEKQRDRETDIMHKHKKMCMCTCTYVDKNTWMLTHAHRQ